MGNKVIAYITSGDRLLVFRHMKEPEAGIQVPGGTVEEGESPEEAALREAQEETGLSGFVVEEYLGSKTYDFSHLGYGIDTRYYYHLLFNGEAPERWLNHERTPSDGTQGTIELEFFWVKYPEEVPKLYSEQDDFQT